MKKLLLSTICLVTLSANSEAEIEKLKQENALLKQRLDALENRLNEPFSDFYVDFDELHKRHLKAINELNEIVAKELEYAKNKSNFSSNKSFSSFYKMGEVISQVKQKLVKNDETNTNEVEFKTYNIKDKTEYTLNDIVKDLDTFKVYLKSKFPELSDIKLDNYYISGDGFTFSTQDLLEKAKISFDDMKSYLKEDFLKELGMF